MSKSKYGDSNLYMTTREFADLVIDALHDQNYFKRNDVAHPQDIAIAFSNAGETIGTAMYWAIKQEHAAKKEAVMKTGNLSKNTHYTSTTNPVNVTYSPNSVLPQDDEIAPTSLSYSEHKVNEGYL